MRRPHPQLIKALPDSIRRQYDDQVAAATTSELAHFVKCPFCADGGAWRVRAVAGTARARR